MCKSKNLMDMTCAFIQMLSGKSIVKARDEFCNAVGWADVTVTIVFKMTDFDGVVGEVQLVHHRMTLVQEGMQEHKAAYKQDRLAAELKPGHPSKLGGSFVYSPFSQITHCHYTQQRCVSRLHSKRRPVSDL